jgi:hypothetical protein
MHRWQKLQNDIVTELNSHRKRVKNDVCGSAEARGDAFCAVMAVKKYFFIFELEIAFCFVIAFMTRPAIIMQCDICHFFGWKWAHIQLLI